MDLETRIYKYSLMIGGALLTVLFLLCTIVYIFISQELGGGGALMFVSMLISIGVFYIGWDTGRNRPEEQEPEDQETTDVEHHQES